MYFSNISVYCCPLWYVFETFFETHLCQKEEFKQPGLSKNLKEILQKKIIVK